MILEFHPAARDEFVAAAEYYETAVPGLGDRFLVAVKRDDVVSVLAVAHHHRRPGYWRSRLNG
jgi:hypothetical protein